MNSRARARSGFSTNCAMGATGAAAARRGECSHSRFRACARRCRTRPACRPRPPVSPAGSKPGMPRDRAARDPPAAPASARRRPRAARAACAASAMAGAVLRPTGSNRMPAGGMPISRSCSATRNRCASLQTTMGVVASGNPASRAAVSWIMVRSPVRASSCLGSSSRDSGQRRVPAPPERITGTSFMARNRTAGRVVRPGLRALPRPIA